MTDTMEQTEQEQVAAEGNGTATTATKAKGIRPTYGLGEPVEQLPPDAPIQRGGGGGGSKLVGVFAELVGKTNLHNKFVPVATYGTPNGAKNAYESIVGTDKKAATIKLPAGEWEVEYRRVPNPDPAKTGSSKRHSVLYAKYITA